MGSKTLIFLALEQDKPGQSQATPCRSLLGTLCGTSSAEQTDTHTPRSVGPGFPINDETHPPPPSPRAFSCSNSQPDCSSGSDSDTTNENERWRSNGAAGPANHARAHGPWADTQPVIKTRSSNHWVANWPPSTGGLLVHTHRLFLGEPGSTNESKRSNKDKRGGRQLTMRGRSRTAHG